MRFYLFLSFDDTYDSWLAPSNLNLSGYFRFLLKDRICYVQTTTKLLLMCTISCNSAFLILAGRFTLTSNFELDEFTTGMNSTIKGSDFNTDPNSVSGLWSFKDFTNFN